MKSRNVLHNTHDVFVKSFYKCRNIFTSDFLTQNGEISLNLQNLLFNDMIWWLNSVTRILGWTYLSTGTVIAFRSTRIRVGGWRRQAFDFVCISPFLARIESVLQQIGTRDQGERERESPVASLFPIKSVQRLINIYFNAYALTRFSRRKGE